MGQTVWEWAHSLGLGSVWDQGHSLGLESQFGIRITVWHWDQIRTGITVWNWGHILGPGSQFGTGISLGPGSVCDQDHSLGPGELPDQEPSTQTPPAAPARDPPWEGEFVTRSLSRERPGKAGLGMNEGSVLLSCIFQPFQAAQNGAGNRAQGPRAQPRAGTDTEGGLGQPRAGWGAPICPPAPPRLLKSFGTG